MTLKDLLKKKDKKIKDDDSQHPQQQQRQQQRYYQQEAFPPPPLSPPPEFKFFRSDTFTTEPIQPPGAQHHSHPESQAQSQSQSQSPPLSNPSTSSQSPFSRLRRFSNASSAGSREHSPGHELSPSRGEKGERRLSQRLHLNRSSRSTSTSSVNLPANLPQIAPDTGDAQEREAQWEKRATIMVQGGLNAAAGMPPPSPRGVIEQQKEGDENIQEAIRLHENGQLVESTQMFGRLADPNGANNPLSQVLYGLALRHGWGCTPDPDKAITYLSAAASNSASIEAEALRAGMKKGGAAKGELVLAMYELANCFRNGWGVAKDPVAARHYYETAANLGDTDAMNEAAWCFLEGFGGKKDRVGQNNEERDEFLFVARAFSFSNFIPLKFSFRCRDGWLQGGSEYHNHSTPFKQPRLRNLLRLNPSCVHAPPTGSVCLA
ncbi:hypothetical protein BDBG_04178 [Blastomyces gilchristii SLH14081]|uniref:Chitin synthase activator n=1 Tax=Blastomyces gilchristii (strain SLH14081) TaxID=559298 RepID=A0A179UJP3_BLAGS|nr:uncharacterized protein BDBG_04178 [Blastomyces gilchristii SLH14081]OAT08204.1 hypothetical protein BDBG_04178 [Blastomyces gilchristii SLH14081]